jgi:hypothetical protein
MASVWLVCLGVVSAQEIVTNAMVPSIERGTYHNYFNCQNPGFGVFAHFDDASGADSRLGQFLVGWDTVGAVPTNQPVTRYLIRRCRVTVTLNNGNQVSHDPTHDPVETYLNPTNNSLNPTNMVYVADSDVGRPIELFGAAFRNGFTATNYVQCSPLGGSGPGAKNAYAFSWSTNGLPVDVGNNVGKTNFPTFETWPFAVAQTTAVAPGELMPAGALLTFDVDLEDPFISGYLQSCLQTGRVHFMVSALHQVSGQFGSEPYPSFTTRFNQAVLEPPTTLDLDVTVVRDIDSEPDGLPDDWEQFYFTNLLQTAEQDSDSDGANNLEEFLAGTNPTLASSIFRVTSDKPAILSWPNLPNRQFSIEYTENLASWQTITNPALIFHSPYTAQWTDTNNAGTRFYRVNAQ